MATRSQAKKWGSSSFNWVSSTGIHWFCAKTRASSLSSAELENDGSDCRDSGSSFKEMTRRPCHGMSKPTARMARHFTLWLATTCFRKSPMRATSRAERRFGSLISQTGQRTSSLENSSTPSMYFSQFPHAPKIFPRIVWAKKVFPVLDGPTSTSPRPYSTRPAKAVW